MNVKDVFENRIYLITNHVVAGNSIFYKPYYCRRFLEKMEHYLSPYCNVISYAIFDTEFQILIKLKDRRSFIHAYKLNRKKTKKSYKKVPHTNYIFAQAMANLQSSMAIHFNRKEHRSGSLFARRYRKIGVENEMELNRWQQRIKSRVKVHTYEEDWKVNTNGKYFTRRLVKLGVNWMVNSEGNGVDRINIYRSLSNFIAFENLELQGQFDTQIKRRVSDKDLKLYLEIRHKISISK